MKQGQQSEQSLRYQRLIQCKYAIRNRFFIIHLLMSLDLQLINQKAL